MDAQENDLHLPTALESQLVLEKSRELADLKNTFIALVSHELRTPLNLLAGFLDLSLEEIDRDQSLARHYLGLVEENTAKLMRVVQELTDFSRLQLGKELSYLDPMSVSDAFLQTFELLKPNLSRKHIRLVADFPEEVKRLRYDGESLIILFRNLLSNAAKFSAEGSKVVVTGKIRDSQLMLSITDWANPIPENKRETIFEDFRQLENHLTRRYEGMGLGLAVARRTALFLGGNIQLAVREDGNTFSILLPIEDSGFLDHQKLP